MRNRKTITIIIVGTLAVGLAFGAMAYQNAFAANLTTRLPTIASTGLTMKRSAGNGIRGGYTNEDLANALGITVDALNTAYQEAYTAELKQAVSNGLITQTQADELTTRGSTFPFGNRWDGWLAQNGIDFDTYLAQALGISTDELKAAYQAADYASIDQQVTDGTITQDQANLMKGEYALFNNSAFQSSMQSAFTSAVNDAVTAGVITQTQADQILGQSNNRLIFGAGIMGGPGGPHGRGGDFMPNVINPPSIAP
jgi:hypothetical protein